MSKETRRSRAPRPSPFSDLVPSSRSEVPPAPPSCSPWGQSRSPTRLCPWGRSPSPARLCPQQRSSSPTRLCPCGRSPQPRSPVPAGMVPRPCSPVPAGTVPPAAGCPQGSAGSQVPGSVDLDVSSPEAVARMAADRPAQKLLSPRPPPPRPAGKGGARCPRQARRSEAAPREQGGTPAQAPRVLLPPSGAHLGARPGHSPGDGGSCDGRWPPGAPTA